MKSSNSLIYILFFLSFLSCRERDGSSDNRYDEIKELSGVAKLKVKGVFNLMLTQSDQESIQVIGNQKLVEKLQINQNGDLLELTLEDVKSSFFEMDELEVRLSISNLESFEFNGVGNVETQNAFHTDQTAIQGEGVGNLELEIQSKQITADLNLVGSMKLKGESALLNITNEGIGNIDASQLNAEKVNLISSGIGRIAVHCTGELSLDVSGIGEVKYTGNPTVIKENVSGIGKVTRN
ncbi:GIN domain-containing protein [Algoriphagus confluentis]|uniref:Putative auto-transporter adhesin head GIN domain-containing protein n=1 Tax=Algoriphagus confluentis TaxID=1697556 RepID=A0ABQ6PJ29_9BACT|nr:hypothetical protein Aconfl_01340 [Algoriphagus confluentis]